jgi:23S rRNA (cytosine1962-C5)-methyltransferase
MIEQAELIVKLATALAIRRPFWDEAHNTACRLFNGFLEGCPELVAELYGRSLVLYNYAEQPVAGEWAVAAAKEFYLQQLPWLQAVVVKNRTEKNKDLRAGSLVHGTELDTRVLENGIWYSINLLLNQDSSLYLDTRNLRSWLVKHAAGWKVLNTFAYTGSLGLAALAGGAQQVEQVDLDAKFLALARQGAALNRLDLGRMNLRSTDFFDSVARLKREKALFDCVIVDPPFFSVTQRGRVNLLQDSQRLINKVRPLVKDGGYLVVINNALFMSGAVYHESLHALCSDGYLQIEERIDAPLDFTGSPLTRSGQPPVDPAPYNHSTKITVIKVRRKDAAAE